MRELLRITACWALLGALALSCGSDHDSLKKKDPPATGGAAGTDAGADAEPDAAADVEPDVFVEPTGVSKLTLLHAVVDSPRIAFCFAKVVDGLPTAPVGGPLPAGGLDFGASLVATKLEGVDWDKDDLLPIIVAGDFSLLVGKSCVEAVALAASFALPDSDAASDAGAAADADASVLDSAVDGDASDDASPPLPPPPKLRSAELPVLPAGTLSTGYSLLLAAAGCIGGAAFADPLETWACGPGYTTSTPTLSPVLVPLSRVVKPGAMGLQVVNAARAADPIDLASSYPQGSSIPKIHVVYDVAFGAISPRPPLLDYSATAFGSPIGASLLELGSQGSSVPVYTSTWKDALALGGLSGVKDGQNYALVLVGPRPNNAADKWWNGPRLVALPADP